MGEYRRCRAGRAGRAASRNVYVAWMMLLLLDLVEVLMPHCNALEGCWIDHDPKGLKRGNTNEEEREGCAGWVPAHPFQVSGLLPGRESSAGWVCGRRGPGRGVRRVWCGGRSSRCRDWCGPPRRSGA